MKISSTVALSYLLLTGLTGCESARTIIADFDINGSVKVLDADGVERNGESAPLEKLAKDTRRLSPYSDLRYEGKRFQITLIVNSDVVQGAIVNKSGSDLQVRFDEATFSSNVQADEVPVLVHRATIHGQHVGAQQGLLAHMPAMRLGPGERGSMSIVPSYANIFPTGRLFGVQFEDKMPVLSKNGVGNSVRLRIPVDFDGKRVYAVFEMTANQTSVRTSYR